MASSDLTDRNARRRAARRANRPSCKLCGDPVPIDRRRLCSDRCQAKNRTILFADWAAKNRAHRAAYQKRWRSTNSEWLTDWYQQNADVRRVQKAAAQRRRRDRGSLTFLISSRDIKRLLDRHGGACAYCRGKFPEVRFSIDHVVPLSRGGEDSIGNIVPACLPCNQSKSSRTVTEWRQSLTVL